MVVLLLRRAGVGAVDAAQPDAGEHVEDAPAVDGRRLAGERGEQHALVHQVQRDREVTGIDARGRSAAGPLGDDDLGRVVDPRRIDARPQRRAPRGCARRAADRRGRDRAVRRRRPRRTRRSIAARPAGVRRRSRGAGRPTRCSHLADHPVEQGEQHVVFRGEVEVEASGARCRRRWRALRSRCRRALASASSALGRRRRIASCRSSPEGRVVVVRAAAMPSTASDDLSTRC